MDPEAQEPEAVESHTDGEPQAAPDPLRELVQRAYPDVVPELLSGETVEEMLASLPAAQEAYRRIVEEAGPARPEAVPSGGGASRAFPIDVGAMSPALKIREGLRRVV